MKLTYEQVRAIQDLKPKTQGKGGRPPMKMIRLVKEWAGRSDLTEKQKKNLVRYRKVVEKWRSRPTGAREIADRFGVKENTIYRIWNGTRRHTS